MLIAVFLGLLAAGWARGQSNDAILCASTSEHLWIVRLTHAQWVLSHHGVKLTGPYLSAHATLANQPQAIAAWQNRVWIVFPPSGGPHSTLRRETFTLQAEYNQPLGIYASVPAQRLEVVTPLPGGGELAGLSGSDGGAIALLIPPQRASASVSASTRSQASEEVLQQPLLLQLRGLKWEEIPLPNTFDPRPESALLLGSSIGGRVTILSRQGAQLAHTSIYVRTHGDDWSVSQFAQDLRDVRAVASVGNQLAMAFDGADPAQLGLGYVRGGEVLPLLHLPRPSGRIALAGLNEQIQLLEQVDRSRIAMTTIEPVSGKVISKVDLVKQPISMRLWQLGLSVAVLAASVLLIFIVRPSHAPAVRLDAGTTLAGLGRRSLALGIDLLPGAITAMVAFRCQPFELLYAPAMTTNFAQSLPYMLMAAITFAHCTLFELWRGASLGKMVMGLRVQSAQGVGAGIRSLVVRNAVKLLVMLVPPLVLVMLLNPNMQGLGDLAARTVVVRRAMPVEP